MDCRKFQRNFFPMPICSADLWYRIVNGFVKGIGIFSQIIETLIDFCESVNIWQQCIPVRTLLKPFSITDNTRKTLYLNYAISTGVQ